MPKMLNKFWSIISEYVLQLTQTEKMILLNVSIL